MELLNCDKPKTPLLQPNNKSPLNKTTTPQRNVRLSSLNTLKPITQSQYTPSNNRISKTSNLSKSDEFEQIENLINDEYRKHEKIDNKNTENEINSNERKYSDDFTTIDPLLINENDNLSIPDNLLIENYSPGDVDAYSIAYDKKISCTDPVTFPKIITKSHESFDDIDFDELMSSLTDDCDEMLLVLGTKSELKNCSSGLNKSPERESKKFLAPIKRSVSLSNPVVKARSMKNKQDIHEYLHGTGPSGDLFTEDHDIYEEYKKYEQEYMNEKAQGPSSVDKSPSPVSASLFGTKPSGDSAYGR